MSSQPESVYTVEAIALNQLFWKAAKPNIPAFLPTTLWVEAFLEPLAGIFYVISALPAIRKEGLWFFKFESVWNVLRAIPLTKYGLATMRQTNGDSSVKFFTPRTINLLSGFFYSFPLIFGSVPIGMITNEVSKINQTITEYKHGYANIISGQLDNESIASLNTIAVKQLMYMTHHSDKVILLARVIAFGYFFNGLLLQLVMSFGYYRILKAVGYQIDTFHNVLEQQPTTTFGDETPKYKSESTPASINVNSTSSGSTRTQAKRLHGRWITIHLPTWLPSLRPDPDFLGKPELTSTNTHHHTRDSQKWESLNQEMIHSQYKSLKRYKVNLIWQAFCNALILISFLGLNVTVFSNLLQVPLHHSLSDLIWFTITWASWSWVLTVGLPFGIVACVVAFSPPITALRENEERVEGYDD
ncbi:hypothetical protein PtA15_7A357 [Puccinia triticina]|uniref:ABC transmembrane type-1 domain-containing protein n=1 Tax=Puccinia triticina TaxID=208348 RepID=A0ABY7CS94_9BASI|nr:uncharacterized protein PtA15_7A357 [Puccinia triticina]WAQ86630.1 hypothetical protein PtA15_7A357 [Puccinia triticina]